MHSISMTVARSWLRPHRLASLRTTMPTLGTSCYWFRAVQERKTVHPACKARTLPGVRLSRSKCQVRRLRRVRFNALELTTMPSSDGESCLATRGAESSCIRCSAQDDNGGRTGNIQGENGPDWLVRIVALDSGQGDSFNQTNVAGAEPR